MTEREEIEQAFWSRVWRCAHRWPCKKCCWPWIGVLGVALYDDPFQCYLRKDRAALFSDHRLSRPIASHRYAYIHGKAGGMATFPGRFVEVCHSCDYQHCCNYAHLSLGATADNGRDKRGKTFAVRSTQPIWFPDGRQLTFPRARGNELRCVIAYPKAHRRGMWEHNARRQFPPEVALP